MRFPATPRRHRQRRRWRRSACEACAPPTRLQAKCRRACRPPAAPPTSSARRPRRRRPWRDRPGRARPTGSASKKTRRWRYTRCRATPFRARCFTKLRSNIRSRTRSRTCASSTPCFAPRKADRGRRRRRSASSSASTSSLPGRAGSGSAWPCATRTRSDGRNSAGGGRLLAAEHANAQRVLPRLGDRPRRSRSSSSSSMCWARRRADACSRSCAGPIQGSRRAP